MKRNLLITFIFFVLIINADSLHGDFNKGFVVAPCALSQKISTLVSVWDIASKQLLAHNIQDTKCFLDVQFYSLENIRGPFQRAAYPNQDYAFVGSLAGKTCIGVFDGHGKETGGIISQFVQKHLPFKVLGYKSAIVGLSKACAWMQEKIKEEKFDEGKEGGTTAIIGVLNGSQLIVGNVGDSRAIGILDGKLTELSIDHKLTNEAERKRVIKAGGSIHRGYVFDKKSGRGLALTRSLGDLLAHYENVVSAEPELTTFTVRPGDILIFASDGLWDVMTNKEVYDYIKKRIDPFSGLKKGTARSIAARARKRSSKDDITVLIAVVK